MLRAIVGQQNMEGQLRLFCTIETTSACRWHGCLILEAPPTVRLLSLYSDQFYSLLIGPDCDAAGKRGHPEPEGYVCRSGI